MLARKSSRDFVFRTVFCFCFQPVENDDDQKSNSLIVSLRCKFLTDGREFNILISQRARLHHLLHPLAVKSGLKSIALFRFC